jgi:predicted metal-dependent hydrolase
MNVAKSTTTLRTMHAIRPRRVRFVVDAIPLCWIPGEPQTTHTIDVLHLLLPAGERWFARVFLEAMPQIEDEELREAVRGFMGQESTHARAHSEVLDHLDAQGMRTELFTRHVDWLFERLLDARPFGRKLPKRLERHWLLHRLALVAAIEHYTALLGVWIVEHSAALDRAGADPTMMKLLRWHGAEEVEHRSVAFDAATSMGAGPVRRAIAMAEVSVALSAFWYEGTKFLMRADPNVKRGGWAAFHDAGRAGLLPTMRYIFGETWRFVLPGFHPSQIGSTERALEVLAATLAGVN